MGHRGLSAPATAHLQNRSWQHAVRATSSRARRGGDRVAARRKRQSDPPWPPRRRGMPEPADSADSHLTDMPAAALSYGPPRRLAQPHSVRYIGPFLMASGPWPPIPVLPVGRHARSASSSTPTTARATDRRPALPRRCQRGAPAHAQPGLPRPQRRAARGPPRAARAPAPAPAGAARPLRPRRRLRRDRRELADIVDEERLAIDEPVDAEARRRAHPAARRRPRSPTTRRTSALRLDLMPQDLAGKVSELQRYDFQSPEAEGAVRGAAGPAARPARAADVRADDRLDAVDDARGHAARMKDMMAALNEMLERHQRERGSPTSTSSWRSTATSSRRTRRTSTSCSSRWPGAWRRCRRCSTR